MDNVLIDNFEAIKKELILEINNHQTPVDLPAELRPYDKALKTNPQDPAMNTPAQLQPLTRDLRESIDQATGLYTKKRSDAHLLYNQILLSHHNVQKNIDQAGSELLNSRNHLIELEKISDTRTQLLKDLITERTANKNVSAEWIAQITIAMLIARSYVTNGTALVNEIEQKVKNTPEDLANSINQWLDRERPTFTSPQGTTGDTTRPGGRLNFDNE